MQQARLGVRRVLGAVTRTWSTYRGVPASRRPPVVATTTTCLLLLRVATPPVTRRVATTTWPCWLQVIVVQPSFGVRRSYVAE